MKLYPIHGAVALMLTMMASCSNENEPQNTSEEFQQVIINASTETIQSRTASTDVARYAISIWEDNNHETPANIFSGNSNLATSDNGNFTLTLNTKKEYHCLLWADDGVGYELGSTLKDITVADNKDVSEAFHGKLELPTGRTESYNVKLTRAVAHFSLLETGEIPAGCAMRFSWSLPNSFNVALGSPTGDDQTTSISWTSETISGTPDTPATLKDGIYVLSSTVKELHTFSYQCNDEDPVVLTNVPTAANYKTNIKGHFTTSEYVNFTISHDTSWNEEENSNF